MLKIFMIEWWDDQAMRARQEYYSRIEKAAERFAYIRDNFPDNDVSIETLNVIQE